MSYRPLSFTKNLGGLDNLHKIIRHAYVPGTTLKEFKARVPQTLANRVLIVEQFFISTKIIDTVEYVVEDALITSSLAQNWNLTLARLYLFALILNMPGQRANHLYRSPAGAQNAYTREVLYDGTGWQAPLLDPTAMEPWVQNNVEIAGGLRKFCTNFSYFFDQGHFAADRLGRLDTDVNVWGPLALRLFFDRVSIDKPDPSSDDLSLACQEREVHKLLGVPPSWINEIAEGAALAYVQGRTELLAALPSAKRPRKGGPAARVTAMISQLQRCAANKRDLVRWYRGMCQICGNTLNIPGGNTVDCAHVKPLGSPHGGDDDTSNMLSLCPNHHRQLDRGAISMKPGTYVIVAPHGSFPHPLERLSIHSNHTIDTDAIRYHYDNIFKS